VSPLPTTPQKPWRNVSASQITKYLACPTQWWWEKIAGFREPPTEAMLRGSRLHKAWERYLIDGTIPEDPIAVATLEHLPAPGSVPRDLVESRVDQTEGLPVPLIGYIDLIEAPTSGHRRVTDHKTTSDFKWCRAPEELATDAQALVYGAEYLRRYPGEGVTFRHVYARTSGRPETTVREVALSPDWIAEYYEKVVTETSHEMAKYAVMDVREVPYKTTACDRYRGCPHKGRCLLVGKQLGGFLGGLFGGNVDDTTKSVASLFGGTPTPVAPAVPAADSDPTVYAECSRAILAATGRGVRLYGCGPVKQAMVDIPVFDRQGDGPWMDGPGRASITEEGAVAVPTAGPVVFFGLKDDACHQAFLGSCATAPDKVGLYFVFGAAPGKIGVEQDGVRPGTPTVNPPDGTPADAVVTVETAPVKNKGKGPFLKNGERVRGMNATRVLQEYKAELTELTSSEREAWQARTSLGMRAWFEAGCPDAGKAAVLKRDIVTDAILLEEIVQDIAAGREPAPAPDVPDPLRDPAAPAPSVQTIDMTPVLGLDKRFGAEQIAADAIAGCYRTSQGHLVELTGEKDNLGQPVARLWSGDALQVIALVPAQPLRPTVETWASNHGAILDPAIIAAAVSGVLPEPTPVEEPAPEADPFAGAGAVISDEEPAPEADPFAGAGAVISDEEPAPADEEPEVSVSYEIPEGETIHVRPQKEGPTLYIGCYPVRGSVPPVLADVLMAPYFDVVAQANGVPFVQLLEYGKGVRQAVAALLLAVQKCPDVLPDLVIDPRHPAGDALAEALTPLYAHVITRIG